MSIKFFNSSQDPAKLVTTVTFAWYLQALCWWHISSGINDMMPSDLFVYSKTYFKQKCNLYILYNDTNMLLKGPFIHHVEINVSALTNIQASHFCFYPLQDAWTSIEIWVQIIGNNSTSDAADWASFVLKQEHSFKRLVH